MNVDTIEIEGLRFGEGLPKLCIPLTGGSMLALLAEAREVRDLPADLYEWRMDSFFGSFSEALEILGRELAGKPLLCTMRTRREGGEGNLSPEAYQVFLSSLLDRGGFSLLDVELSCGEDRVRCLVEKAGEKGIAVIISKHDFEKTPGEEEIFQTLEQMKSLGADLPKAAYMPQKPGDVLALLSATLRARESLGPVITMSMGGLGKISRVSGGVFGSCVTFGAGRNASAPGQINAEDLKAILEDLDPGKGEIQREQ